MTVGNGFRYGVRYLAWSGLLGAAGIGTLIVAAPGWTGYGTIGAGVLLSHVGVTIYTGALLARLRRTQHELERMATSDALTGLPNRRVFMDRLSQTVLTRDRRRLACLYLDLDEFAVMLDGPPSAEHARAAANRIIEAVEGIESVDGQRVDVSVSVGISVIAGGAPARPVGTEELLKAADDAMCAAKRSGKGRHCLVDMTAAAGTTAGATADAAA